MRATIDPTGSMIFRNKAMSHPAPLRLGNQAWWRNRDGHLTQVVCVRRREGLGYVPLEVQEEMKKEVLPDFKRNMRGIASFKRLRAIRRGFLISVFFG